MAIRYGYPKGQDVEALAEALYDKDKDQPDQYELWRDQSEAVKDIWREYAVRFLTSDWLASHDAALIEQARAEGKAEADALRGSKAALIEKVKRLEDQIARAVMEPGQDRQKAMHAYAARAETAEKALAEADAAWTAKVKTLADEWERDEAYACVKAAECVRCVSFQRAVIRLRALIGEAGK